MTTLYLKYRPQRISELDLVDVREILTKIVSSGDIPHAFLFEGPRGSGKTSAARILAKVLNCTDLTKDNEPCNKCEQCVSITKGTNIDVIELDAASHRGIDDVRTIRDSVKLSPAKAYKKVYIIDEAHMLTTEASNALLKTLEEPPEHVVFVLATTNPEKILETIKSRTVRVNFKKATTKEIVKSLTTVLETEKKKYKEEVLELIAQNVDGSFRDAKKILEELMISEILTDLEKAREYLLNSNNFKLDEFFNDLYKKDVKASLAILTNAEKAGVPAKTIYAQIVVKLKGCLFSVVGYSDDPNNVFSKKEVLLLIDLFMKSWSDYQNDISDYMPFYLAVSKWCELEGGREETVLKKISAEKKDGIKSNGVKNLDGVASELVQEKIGTNGIGEVKFIPNGENLTDGVWKQILQVVRNKNASTEALLRASKPMGFDGKILSLGVFYKFHKEKLESIPHKLNLEDCLQDALGRSVRVECYLTEPEIVVKQEDFPRPVGIKHDLQKPTSNGVILTETGDSDLEKLADEVFGS